VVGVAQGMLGIRVLAIGVIAIVHHLACALGQNANGIVRQRAPLVMHFQMGERLGAGYMHPAQLAFHSPAGLIQVHHFFRPDQVLSNLLIDRRDRLGYLLAALDQRAFTEWAVVQLAQDLAGALQRNVMVLVEVHRLSFDLRPILHRLGHPSRKFGLVHL
jgi:hypothetical protein